MTFQRGQRKEKGVKIPKEVSSKRINDMAVEKIDKRKLCGKN